MKIKNIEDFFSVPFYAYFMRQPTLSLLPVRELLKLHKKHYAENISIIDSNISHLTGATGTKINFKTLEIFSKEKQKETLPIIPTYILFGIYLSNIYQKKIDTKTLKKIMHNAPSGNIKKSSKKPSIHKVISITQFLIKK